MTSMPDGAYFAVVGRITAGAGGQTRMMLLRHRLFAEHLGIDVPILTYNPAANYDPIRESLDDDGLLLPQSRVLNLYEDLRGRDLDGLASVAVADEPAYAREGTCLDYLDDDGMPWRRRWTTPSGIPWFEYLRTDGTVFARTRADGWAGTTQICASDGHAFGSWPTRGGLWRWWTTQLAPATGHVFLVSDSRRAAQSLSSIQDPRFFVLHQMHNPHTVGRRHWTSDIGATYRDSMDRLGRLDALSCLTHRQRDDVARRFGATDNLVVIPNPVEIPDEPQPPPVRHPGRLVIIARLDKQKRLDRAIAAFALLVVSHPYARLDIYGEGPERQALEQQIDKAGLTKYVTLHGHDPHAADQLWSADLAWLTSAFEGYSLVMLEARARGCPVVSFDMPYGASEQIVDGVDGRLVPLGDVAALAQATRDLLDDRALLESMRVHARDGAAERDYRPFLAAWRDVVADAVTRKPARTRIDEVVVDSLRMALPTRLNRITSSGQRLKLTSELRVDGIGDLNRASLHWQAYTSSSAEPLDLPISVRRESRSMLVTGNVPAQALSALGPGRHRVTLRLILVWANSAWQHDLLPGCLPVNVRRDGRVLATSSAAERIARRLAGRARRELRRLRTRSRAAISGRRVLR